MPQDKNWQVTDEYTVGYSYSVALLRMVAPGAGFRGVTLFWS